MATLDDLSDQIASWLQSLTDDTSRVWPDKPTPIAEGAVRAFPRIVATSEVSIGSNNVLRLVEVELTVAHRRTSLQSYATALDTMHARMTTLTRVAEWIALAAVRQSPLPEITVERDLEKVGGVLVFSIRAQVALEG